jgi:rubredoxin
LLRIRPKRFNFPLLHPINFCVSIKYIKQQAKKIMAKLHVHTPRWCCQACGYIFTSAPAASRAGEAEPQPQACPECGAKSIKKLEEGGF